MKIPKYLVIKLEQTDKETGTATDITGRCEVIEHDADRNTEPQTCETCKYWKYIAREWQCETTKCQGYTPKTEPQTEREGE